MLVHLDGSICRLVPAEELSDRRLRERQTGIISFDAPNVLAACQCLESLYVRGRTYQDVKDAARAPPNLEV